LRNPMQSSRNGSITGPRHRARRSALSERLFRDFPKVFKYPPVPLAMGSGLKTSDFTWISIGYILQGAFGGALYSQLPSYLSERFPTEVRATAAGFCYHQGAIWGGFVPVVLAFCAEYFHLGLVIPMLVGTVVAAFSVVIALLLSPETKGKELVADLVVART